MIKEPKRLTESSDALGTAISALRQQAPSARNLEALAARLAAAGASTETRAEPPGGEVSRLIAGPKLRVVSNTRLINSGTVLVMLALVLGAGLIATALAISGAVTPLPPPPPPAFNAPAPRGEPALGSGDDTAPNARSGGSDNPDTKLPAHAGGEATPAANMPAVPIPSASPTVVPPTATTPLGEVPERDASRNEPVAGDPARPTSPGRAKARSSTEAQGAPLAENTVVESEIELLKRAKSALGADALEAFALTERCRGRYPNGSFAQEREYIAISALARLGRADEARSRAALFRMHYPNSAYLTRLAPLLGEP